MQSMVLKMICATRTQPEYPLSAVSPHVFPRYYTMVANSDVDTKSLLQMQSPRMGGQRCTQAARDDLNKTRIIPLVSKYEMHRKY